MARCRDIFDRIKSLGERAIDEFIEQRASEELFLDFKRSSDNGSSVTLTDIDRKNLSKAISGFGNSEGGVIVWGIDCSRDRDGADVAKEKISIENVARFVANLQGAVSGCTIPPHSTVEHYPLEIDPSGKGYAVTLIPSSVYAPHQTVKPPQYYIRAGSDFVPTPHQVLAGMFGRRPQPHIYPMFILAPVKYENNTLIVNCGIMITNGGPGIAEDIFFSAMIHSKAGENCVVSWSILDNRNWSGQVVYDTHMSLISNDSFRLPPDSFVHTLSLEVRFEPPFTEPLLVKSNIGCSGSPSSKLVFNSKSETIAQLYDDFFKKLDTDDLTSDYETDLVRKILGIPELDNQNEA